MDELRIVGKSIPRVDAIGKAIGSTIYTADINLSGMLYGKVLQSPFPHARILNIDISRAAKLRGVKAIVTGRDFNARYGHLIQDQTYFCCDKTRYIGEPVAAVAAIDEYTAGEALDMIKVDYEELPAVLDPVKAMEPDSPLVHENLADYPHDPRYPPSGGTNICQKFKIRKGDIEQGFKNSEIISEDTFKTPVAQHCHLEPHVSVAQMDNAGRLTIWTNTQTPYRVLREISKSLGIPMNKIGMIGQEVGGGFGGKVGVKIEPLCVALAMKVKNNRPVKISLTRIEEFQGPTLVRHASVVKVKTGVKKDGTILARHAKIILDTGAYADGGPSVTRTAGITAAGPYDVPNLHVDSYCVYTNKSIAGAFRGFGSPQVMWAMESQMDTLAEELGMDPVEFRMVNALKEGSSTATGQILTNAGIMKCIQRVREAVHWDEIKKIEGRGKGISSTYKKIGAPHCSHCFIKLNEDCTAEVQLSTVDMGQGSNTVLAQIVAEELGLSVDNVFITNPATDFTPYDFGTTSSRSTVYMGNAVKSATEGVRKQLLGVAAKLMDEKPSELTMHDGFVWVQESPERRIAAKEVIMKAFKTRRSIIGSGVFDTDWVTPLDPETGQGDNPIIFWLYGAVAAEVEVDRETGKINVLRLTAAHDVGKAINPLNCEQQIEGGLVMGASLALMEELKLGKKRTINSNLTDYKVATAMDVPMEIIPILVETHHEKGPYGALGIGEAPTVGVASAIANAIYDAVGVRIKDLPITPDKVLDALKRKAQEEKDKDTKNRT
jgi:carbon-monoxide dehydrogenase large subunit